MTQTEREALEALRQKATQGEWRAVLDGESVNLLDAVATLESWGMDEPDSHAVMANGVRDSHRRANAELIAAAVNALPALLADSKALELAAVQVEHERARAERLEQALREVEQRIRQNADPIAELVNRYGGAVERAAYAGLYSAAIHAQAALGEVKP